MAYESTILSIRADISDCKDEKKEVCFASSDLVRALDYAVSHGVKIINMSLGGDGRMGFIGHPNRAHAVEGRGNDARHQRAVTVGRDVRGVAAQNYVG